MNPYDWALFRRTLLASAVLTAFTIAIVVATDEATSTVATRAARIAALAPLVIAVALLGVSAHAESRGELRALEALGLSPWASRRGAERAGFLVAVLGLSVLVAPFTDVSSLLPAVRPVVGWILSPDRTVATAPGLVVNANGVVEMTAAAALPAFDRASALNGAIPCVAPVACAAPTWAATPMSLVARLSSGVLTALLVIVALHLVAAARISPPLGAAASLPMWLAAWSLRRRFPK